MTTMKQEQEEEEEVKVKKVKKRKYVIEDVLTRKTDRIEPLLVDFANGQPLEGAELRGTLHCASDKRGKPSGDRILTVQTPLLSYAGTDANAQKPSGVNMFLGLMDKTTGKIRLIEASQYTVQPVIRKPAPRATGGENPEAMTYAQKQEAIAAAFGSRKAKQAVARRLQNKVDADTMSAAIGHAATTAVGACMAVEQHLEQKEESSLIGILPPCHREASQVEDVYRLEELAPDDFLAYMEEPATALLTGGQELDPKTTLLVREMVDNAKYEVKFENQLRLCCVALLVNHLLAFLLCRDKMLRDFEKGKSMDGCSRGVASWIVQEYTQKQGNLITRTQQDLDRATCFILILSFISNKYNLPASTILQSVPIKKERLTSLMRVIGATYRSATHSYQLKLPLAQLSQSDRKKKLKKRNN